MMDLMPSSGSLGPQIALTRNCGQPQGSELPPSTPIHDFSAASLVPLATGSWLLGTQLGYGGSRNGGLDRNSVSVRRPALHRRI